MTIKFWNKFIGISSLTTLNAVSISSLSACAEAYQKSVHTKINDLESVLVFRYEKLGHLMDKKNYTLANGWGANTPSVSNIDDVSMLKDISKQLTAGNIFNAIIYTLIWPLSLQLFTEYNQLKETVVGNVDISLNNDIVYLSTNFIMEIFNLPDSGKPNSVGTRSVEYFFKSITPAPLCAAKKQADTTNYYNIKGANQDEKIIFGDNDESNSEYWDTDLPSNPFVTSSSLTLKLSSHDCNDITFPSSSSTVL